MVYTARKPRLVPSSDELRARIPGWGADLDPADRPSVPREQYDPDAEGPPPDRQPERWPRERSIEHERLPPVFGTSCPPKGLSGAIRKIAYRRYSEARAAHWLLLLGADRIDAWESHLQSFFTTRPDNPIDQTGVIAEFKYHGITSRLGKRRADLHHQWLDPIIVAGPWLALLAAAGAGAKCVHRHLRRSGEAAADGRQPGRPGLM
jgi:hypothetical protein